MQTLLVCLLIAVLLPILAKAPLAIAQSNTGKYNNNNPREQQANLEGFGARALAAHQNSFEALIMFSPCVLAAIATNTTSQTVMYSAVTFIVARVLYVVCYLVDQASLRSIVWFIGFLASLNILFQTLRLQ